MQLSQMLLPIYVRDRDQIGNNEGQHYRLHILIWNYVSQLALPRAYVELHNIKINIHAPEVWIIIVSKSHR
jgi:hypothetical protein